MFVKKSKIEVLRGEMEKKFNGMSDEVVLRKKDSLDVFEQAFVDQGFCEHALENVNCNAAIQTFALTAKREEDLLGALTGRLFWGSLHIRHLFVTKPYRNQGIGRRLVEEGMRIGIENQCRFAVVETMSFQALDFYLKLGFRMDFSRDGYDQGCIFYYLSKPLV